MLNKNDKQLFAVIIPSYNQERTIYESVISVLIQNYENIELIITDDASISFNISAIQKFIDANKRDNIRNVILLSRDHNVGTVRNLNSAIQKANGYYITMFAGDDCLYDENTISNYAKAFSEFPDRNIITAQCYRYDSELKEFLFKQISVDRAYKINESSAHTQFKLLSETNTFAMGATAFKKHALEKFGYFDEKYRLIEDWPLFLRLTRNGELFKFVDFTALKHRAGGLSKRKNRENNLLLSSREFCLELLAVFENEIFPYMQNFTLEEQAKRIEKYIKLSDSNKELMSNTVYESKNKVKMRLLLKYPVTMAKIFLINGTTFISG